MTNEEKLQIAEYRAAGWGPVRIARQMHLSENTVKSYCRRSDATKHKCLQCGKSVEQYQHRKEKKFCSDACRMRWWNDHPDKLKRKAVYEYTCLYCGRAFTAYGNAHRKYCSHECYIQARFGGKYND